MGLILAMLLAVPFAGGGLAWLAGSSRNANAPRAVATGALLIELVLVLALWGLAPNGAAWAAQLNWSWIPRFGIVFHLGADGLSIIMVLLAAVLGLFALTAPHQESQSHRGFFHLCVLWTLTGVIGVFLALDLFLFFLFWELMLIPMYFIIALWGHEQRQYAAVKFFLFTQAGGLLLLLAILALVFVHQQQTGVLSFDYATLRATAVPAGWAPWLLGGFLLAFAVKLPAVPLHTWLPDAHTQAPTAGSVLLAGLLLKTGAYGMLRFAVPLFPDAARAFAPFVMAAAVIAILYGALLAFGQRDVKRLVAYTSVSHMGFVLLGIFAWNGLALQGVIVEMVAHGLSTGALFMLAGILQARLGTRDMERMGGLWASAPRLGGLGLFFALAALGLPGLANFIGEILILLGTYRVAPVEAAVAATGLIVSAIYALYLVQRVFHGRQKAEPPPADLRGVSALPMVGAALLVVLLGLFPQTLLTLSAPAVSGLIKGPPAGAEQQRAAGPFRPAGR